MGKDCAYFQPSLRDERLRYLYPAFKRRATLNASLWDANAIRTPRFLLVACNRNYFAFKNWNKLGSQEAKKRNHFT